MAGTDLFVLAREELLHLFWAVGLVLAAMFSCARWRKKVLSGFGTKQNVALLLSSMHTTRRLLKSGLFVTGLSLLVLAASGPMWGKKAVIVESRGKDVFFIVDISASMTAEDLRPSRLHRAKLETSRLIEELEGNRLGIIIFAGESFVLCPLTLDAGACALLMDCIDARNVPRPGTSLAASIEAAVEGFEGGEKSYKAVVLVTDGEDLEGDVERAISLAVENGVRVFTLGVGTPEGAPIPLRAENGMLEGYKKDKQGQTVVTRLDEELLVRIARETGGEYAHVREGSEAMRRIARGIGSLDEKVLKEEEMKIYKERFQFPLAAAFVLLFIEAWVGERRRT